MGVSYLGQEKSVIIFFFFILATLSNKVTTALMDDFSWQAIPISFESIFVQCTEFLILAPSFIHMTLCTSYFFLFLQALVKITCFLSTKEANSVCFINILDMQ